ncbi:MAG: class I SAM-dependent methyltransferase [archaeon]|nr:class I SAM-dependent methyltransferase [archaeon]
MNRTEIINILIKKNNYKTYLEIGVNTPAQPGYNWDGVRIETKHGVDPSVDTTYKMTSDEFFDKHITMNYDIVFIDGLHIFEQAHRDIVNSLNHLNDGGTIVVHDCNPKKEITQRRIRATSVWHGDVWKAILKLRIENPDIQIYTINADEGCGIIQKSSQVLLKPMDAKEDIYTYNFFKNNKEKILNLISVKEFKKKFNIPFTWYEKIWK